MLHDLVVFLHILSMAIWIAAVLWLAGDVRRALGAGRVDAAALRARFRPALGLDVVAGLSTLVTGALLVWQQALGMPRAGITAGILLTLVRLGVLAALRRAFRGIADRLAAGQAVGADDPAARRLSMLSGIAHLCWLLALAGMVFDV